jgi:hypothetical protein
MNRSRIPVLTNAVVRPALTESALGELQVRIVTSSFMLVEKLLHQAYDEMEATLFDGVVGRLRHELPELIDQILREHFKKDLKDG